MDIWVVYACLLLFAKYFTTCSCLIQSLARKRSHLGVLNNSIPSLPPEAEDSASSLKQWPFRGWWIFEQNWREGGVMKSVGGKTRSAIGNDQYLSLKLCFFFLIRDIPSVAKFVYLISAVSPLCPFPCPAVCPSSQLHAHFTFHLFFPNSLLFTLVFLSCPVPPPVHLTLVYESNLFTECIFS